MRSLKLARWTLGALILFGLTGTAAAQNRFFVGARNLGMGNTGVATATDALAVHYNPAGMAFAHSWEIQFPLIAFDAEINGDLISEVDELSDKFDLSSLSAIQDRFDQGIATSEDLETVLDAFLYELPDIDVTGEGGTLRGSSGPAFRWKNWGVSVSFLGNGGVDATVDLTNGLSLGPSLFDAIPQSLDTCNGDPTCIGLAQELVGIAGPELEDEQAERLVTAAGAARLSEDEIAWDIMKRIVEATAAGTSSLADNESGVITTTIAVQQLAFTYSHMIFGDKLSVGGNLKVMQGETGRVATFVGQLEDGEDTFQNAIDDLTGDENFKTSTEFGLDIGFMYRPTPKWSVGLVGTNLNSPSFEVVRGEDLKIDPRVRVGGAFIPFKWFNVALDVDLNEVESQLIRDLGYQYANLGVEFLAGRWFSGWLGAYQNMAPDNAKPVYTGGLGFGIGRFQIALSGAVSSDEVRVGSGDDNVDFPSGASASLQLAWRPRHEPRS